MIPIMKHTLTVFCLIISILPSFSAKLTAPEIEKRLKTEHIDSLRVKYYLDLGVIYATQKPELSKAYIDTGFLIARHHKYDHYIAVANANYGVYYSYRSDYSMALEYYLKALEHFENRKDTARIVAINMNIGRIHVNLKHYDQAMSIFEKSLKLDKSDLYNPLSMRRLIYMNIGAIYFQTKKPLKAKQYYKVSLVIAEFVKDYNIIRGVCNNLSEVYLQLNRPDSALIYIKKGMTAAKLNNNNIGLASSYKALAKYYMFKKEYSNAIQNLRTALNYSKSTGYLRETSDIYYTISEAYRYQNKYKEAYQSYVNYKITADSIFNERITRELAQKELQYEFDKKQKKNELEQLQRRYNNIILISVLSLLLIIAALLYFLMQRRMKQAKLESKNLELEKITLEQDLELKNKELTANIMYLLQKNELITNISEKLKDLKKFQKAENQEVISGILADINTNVSSGMWEEFELRFLQVHQNFYDNLILKHPDLTSSELKLCAFLRLNISTKDIATITHQNPKSIEVARSRLRKKLNINNQDVNLVVYLMEF